MSLVPDLLVRAVNALLLSWVGLSAHMFYLKVLLPKVLDKVKGVSVHLLLVTRMNSPVHECSLINAFLAYITAATMQLLSIHLLGQ